MDKHILNLKFAIKDLTRQSKKCEKHEQLEKSKIKRYLQKGSIEIAKFHAENAIRLRNQSLNYLQLSVRVDTVLSRIQSALATKKLTKSMAGVINAMDVSMKNMDIETIGKAMDKLERQFDNFNVKTTFLEETAAQTTTTMTPQADIDNLIKQIADENNLEFNMELPHPIPPEVIDLKSPVQSSRNQKDLNKRLAVLRKTQ